MGADFDRALLVRAAWEVAQRAYAPYSGFRVGAALMARSGRIFSACNVENASYGLTICAERAAVCQAVSEGTLEFQALAICVPGGGTPCGACRQVLHEFNPNLPILVADQHQNLLAEYRLEDLLPHPFSPRSLSKPQ